MLCLQRRSRSFRLLSVSLPKGFVALLSLSFLFVSLLLANMAYGSPPPCEDAEPGWCRALRIQGQIPNGELGFRFGSPMDVDGDGVADIAAGARWKMKDKIYQNGFAAVWSGRDGHKIQEWDPRVDDGMFGHAVLLVDDLDGDDLADVLVSSPTAPSKGVAAGMIAAYSPKTGRRLWNAVADGKQRLGWDLARAGDQDADGIADVFAGAPSDSGGHVYLLSGKDGSILETYAPPAPRWSFGWYVAATDDLDGDGRQDLLVGAFVGDKSGDTMGRAYLFSATGGLPLQQWVGEDEASAFGEVVAAVGDLDGDGLGDLAVSAAWSGDPSRRRSGEVRVYSSASGAELRRFVGKQPGEYYGRMVADAGDLDGDGTRDLAIGAPQHRVGDADKTGRVELRSGRTGAVLGEWFGRGADHWFGWHLSLSPHPSSKTLPALLIGSLRAPVNGRAGAGLLDLYLRKP